jgi:hypothetical protein
MWGGLWETIRYAIASCARTACLIALMTVAAGIYALLFI